MMTRGTIASGSSSSPAKPGISGIKIHTLNFYFYLTALSILWKIVKEIKFFTELSSEAFDKKN